MEIGSGLGGFVKSREAEMEFARDGSRAEVLGWSAVRERVLKIGCNLRFGCN